MSSEEKKPQLRIAIIGAGYAGLAAAVTIAQNNIPVTVFEAAEVLGGRARRVERRGVTLDNGLHILLGAYRETLRLISLVAGAETPKFVRLPFRWEIAQHFRAKASPFPAPLDLLFGLLLARGTTLPEKIAAIRFVQKMPSVTENCSVLELLERGRQGENLVRFLWRPLCVAALNTPVEKASAQVFLNVVRAVLKAKSSDLIFAGEDLSRLFPDRAASYIKLRGGAVHIKHRITGLRKSQEGFELESPRGIDRFSHVVCALSP
ncbi:MAG: FAD-dependent oxidoreductase, partial [Burkholderiales bacterium]